MRTVELFQDGDVIDSFSAASLEDAVALAHEDFEEWAQSLAVDLDETTWCHAEIRVVDWDPKSASEDELALVGWDGKVSLDAAVEPIAPSCCDDDDEHDWENASVLGHGGGVIITDECANCGLIRVIDTWAQDPVTGEQGLRSTAYEKDVYLL